MRNSLRVQLTQSLDSHEALDMSAMPAGMSLEEVQDLFHAKVGDGPQESPRQLVRVDAA